MYYVYVLQSPRADEIYVGFSTDLGARIKGHQSLLRHREWRLVYYEAYSAERDARRRERRLKHHGSGLVELKKRLEHSLNLVR